MNDKAEMTVLKHVRNFHVQGVAATKSQKQAVSKVQYMDTTSDLELDFFMMGANKQTSGIDPAQAKYMNKLVNTAVDSNQTEKLLIFLPHGDTPMK